MKSRNPSIKEMKVMDMRLQSRLHRLEKSMHEIEMKMAGLDKRGNFKLA